ncbi:hypothetical protein BGX23_005255 [Mortierella sp. AD031]|nr:hypothetical protein BGX23_005255 [Mortierella sp. AD031]KAG0214904.1 hypothetical protein BGX33_001692 [Mortierella sp. NVP41]
MWHEIYGLLSSLRVAHTLTIKSRHLDKTLESGIHLLGGAPQLERLRLIDPTRQAWTREEVDNLTNAVSTLKALDLRPLTVLYHSRVNSWLVASGKRYLCF